MEHRLLAYRPDLEWHEAEWTGSALPAGDEMQDAAELLEQPDAGALQQWLVRLIERRGLPPGPTAHALARLISPLARRVAAFARPQGDAAVGAVFGLELEGLSSEDQAFEVARHFVRFATAAARRARSAAGPPATAARQAALHAARQHAPGLLRRMAPGPPDAAFAGGDPWPPPVPEPGRTPDDRRLTPLMETTMHDIDRTQMEFGAEAPTGFEAEQFEFGEGEWSAESVGLLSEADEYELASELLGVASEEELDQFLGNLIKRVGGAAGRLIRSPVGRAIGGVLKGVAKKALPLAGGALGGMVGGPLGAKIGSGLASAAGSALGLEGEAMAQEDQEFEGAKQFVRLAADTVKKAAAAPASADPRATAQAAAMSAARQLAPGLLRPGTGAGSPSPAVRGRSGRWARRGNSIVLYGA
jgi:hypothetical protein